MGQGGQSACGFSWGDQTRREPETEDGVMVMLIWRSHSPESASALTSLLTNDGSEPEVVHSFARSLARVHDPRLVRSDV